MNGSIPLDCCDEQMYHHADRPGYTCGACGKFVSYEMLDANGPVYHPWQPKPRDPIDPIDGQPLPRELRFLLK